MDDEILNDEDVISCATGVTVKEGDTVTVMLVDGVPTVISSSSSEQTATEASETAQRVEAHFWHDAEGAHVSEAEKSVEGHNILIDTDSVDIRNGLFSLATFSSDGVEIYPGGEYLAPGARFAADGLHIARRGVPGGGTYSYDSLGYNNGFGGFSAYMDTVASIAQVSRYQADYGLASVALRVPLKAGDPVELRSTEKLKFDAPQMDVPTLGASFTIPANSDLNDYLESGTFYVTSSANWNTIVNRPLWPGGAAHYVVVKRQTASLATQWAINSYNGRTYTRRWTTAAGWTNWYAPSGIVSVVDEGTSGNWTYIKWSNGIAMCFGRFNDSNTAITTSANGAYRSDTKSVSYPFQFLSAPTVLIDSVCSSSGISSWQMQSYLASLSYRYGLPSSGTPTTLISSIVVIGSYGQ